MTGRPNDAPAPQEQRPTVLVVDADAAFTALLVEELAPHFVVERATDGRTALRAATTRSPAAIILDQALPDIPGIDLIDEIRKADCHAPIIMVITAPDGRVAATAMRRGAADFIIKDMAEPYYEDIVPTALRAIEKASNDRELEYLRDRQAEQTRHAQALNRQLSRTNADLEAAFQQLRKKNERLSELYETAHRFVDNVSHEMRTPLTVIKEFLAIVLDGLSGDLNDAQREYLGIAANKTHDLAQMVDDMLDLSKVEAGLLRVERVPCAVDAVVAGVADLLEHKARANDITLQWDVPSDLPMAFCDQDKTGRVLINLVVNGLKFSPDGATMTVRARADRAAGVVTIEVEDHGPGIAAEHLQVIFERFRQLGAGRQSSTTGFGLGLNIVRELVHLNFGDITVRSTPGIGSTFSYTVPIFDPPVVLRRYLERAHTFDHHGRRLALIRVAPLPGAGVATDVVRGAVAHHIAPFDVIFERPQHGDVVVMVITDDGPGQADRLTRQNSAELRLSPGSTIDLTCAVLAEWDLAAPATAIIPEALHILAPTQEVAP